MKKIVKKLSVVLIIILLFSSTGVLASQPPIPNLSQTVSEVADYTGLIIYLLEIGAVIISILFFIINVIKIIISKINNKTKYYILAFLIMLLGLSSVGILQLTHSYAEGIGVKPIDYTPIIITGITMFIVSIILNIILLIRINKRNKINRRIADEKNGKKD